MIAIEYTTGRGSELLLWAGIACLVLTVLFVLALVWLEAGGRKNDRTNDAESERLLDELARLHNELEHRE